PAAILPIPQETQLAADELVARREAVAHVERRPHRLRLRDEAGGHLIGRQRDDFQVFGHAERFFKLRPPHAVQHVDMARPFGEQAGTTREDARAAPDLADARAARHAIAAISLATVDAAQAASEADARRLELAADVDVDRAPDAGERDVFDRVEAGAGVDKRPT